MVNVNDALLKSDDSRIIATTAQIQLCVISKFRLIKYVVTWCLPGY